MIASSTLILFVSLYSWSIFLRYLAFFLVKDCVPAAKFKLQFSLIDLIATAWWLFACNMLSNGIYSYFIFLSALWVTVHTDLQHMLISRFVSLYLIPIGIVLSWAEILPINPIESGLAAIFGYGFFFIANKLFYLFKGHDGLGQGDLELIACVGAFTGFLGCWFTVLLGSLIGTVFGCCYLLYTRKTPNVLPFGPFLALASSTFVLFQSNIILWLIART